LALFSAPDSPFLRQAPDGCALYSKTEGVVIKSS
jgi:hypothetical protein